jgi:hypothetical protein
MSHTPSRSPRCAALWRHTDVDTTHPAGESGVGDFSTTATTTLAAGSRGAAEERFRRRQNGSSAGPAWRAPSAKPPLSIGRALPSLLFPRQLSLLAQSYLEEHQEHDCPETEGDQRDGEHFAGQTTDQGGADRPGDYERGGRSKCQEARAGRHRPKLPLRLAAEQITVAGNTSDPARRRARTCTKARSRGNVRAASAGPADGDEGGSANRSAAPATAPPPAAGSPAACAPARGPSRAPRSARAGRGARP